MRIAQLLLRKRREGVMVGCIRQKVGSTMLVVLLSAALLLLRRGTAEILYIREGYPCTALGGEPGTCQLLTDCHNPGNFKVDQPPICGFKGLVPIICCPVSTGLREEDFRFDATAKKVVQFCRNYSESCQRQSKDESAVVLDGKAERPYEHTYMAVIGYGDQNRKVWNCGASIISRRFLLSTASCAELQPLGPARWARLGGLELLFSSFAEDNSSKDWVIVERIAHPEYRSGVLYHDIALFRLEQEVTFDLWIGPICLQASRTLPKNTYAVATIWSETVNDTAHENGIQKNSNLLEYNMTLNNIHDCRLLFNGSDLLPNGIEPNSMFCAGVAEGTVESCSRETGGGPLLTDSKSRCTKTQIGIAAYRQRSCGVPSAPTLYIKVNYYLPWLQGIVFPG